jgi:hypothetical protein
MPPISPDAPCHRRLSRRRHYTRLCAATLTAVDRDTRLPAAPSPTLPSSSLLPFHHPPLSHVFHLFSPQFTGLLVNRRGQLPSSLPSPPSSPHITVCRITNRRIEGHTDTGMTGRHPVRVNLPGPQVTNAPRITERSPGPRTPTEGQCSFL